MRRTGLRGTNARNNIETMSSIKIVFFGAAHRFIAQG